MRFIIVLFLAIILGYFAWKNFTIPKTVGLQNGNLFPCPNRPNCICCVNKNSEHAIEPIPYTSPTPLDQIASYLDAHYDVEIVRKTPTYMHAVVTSKLCRFKDDLEFLVDQERQTICVRSASRIGYSDLGANRKRVEKIKEFMRGN